MREGAPPVGVAKGLVPTVPVATEDALAALVADGKAEADPPPADAVAPLIMLSLGLALTEGWEEEVSDSDVAAVGVSRSPAGEGVRAEVTDTLEDAEGEGEGDVVFPLEAEAEVHVVTEGEKDRCGAEEKLATFDSDGKRLLDAPADRVPAPPCDPEGLAVLHPLNDGDPAALALAPPPPPGDRVAPLLSVCDADMVAAGALGLAPPVPVAPKLPPQAPPPVLGVEK